MNSKYLKGKTEHSNISKKARQFLEDVLVIEKKKRIKPYFFIKCLLNLHRKKEEDMSTHWTNSIKADTITKD